MSFDFYILDVFTDSQFSGNPLAVVVNANLLEKSIKQSIAAEMNFSETCFLNAIEENNGGFELEIFTPSQEIAFAGHPILGAAKVLVDQYYSGHEKSIVINLKNEQVSISFDGDESRMGNIWFSSPKITVGSIISKDDISSILNVDKEIFKDDLPIQEISAFTSALILPFSSGKQLKQFCIEDKIFEELDANKLPNLLYCFTDNTFENSNDYQVRFFFNSHGVREDPATGNGAAFFGAYLDEHNQIDNNNIIKIEQGHNLGRPSLISIKVSNSDVNSNVSVGGHVIMNVKGEIIL